LIDLPLSVTIAQGKGTLASLGFGKLHLQASRLGPRTKESKTLLLLLPLELFPLFLRNKQVTLRASVNTGRAMARRRVHKATQTKPTAAFAARQPRHL